MKPNDSSIRARGQRSIPSTFLFRASSRSEDTNKREIQVKAAPNKKLSLSDFLNRKLHKIKTSELPNTVEGKHIPFSSPDTCKDVSGSIHSKIGVKKEGDKCVLDEVVFKQFKHDRKDKEDGMGSCSVDEIGSCSREDVQESRKRRNPFQGKDEKPSAKKHLVILGDDPKPKPKGRKVSSISSEKPIPIYNHYKSGSGWWDDNMEGIDTEEVGCNDVWEGVGSTTLGGLDWH